MTFYDCLLTRIGPQPCAHRAAPAPRIPPHACAQLRIGGQSNSSTGLCTTRVPMLTPMHRSVHIFSGWSTGGRPVQTHAARAHQPGADAHGRRSFAGELDRVSVIRTRRRSTPRTRWRALRWVHARLPEPGRPVAALAALNAMARPRRASEGVDWSCERDYGPKRTGAAHDGPGTDGTARRLPDTIVRIMYTRGKCGRDEFTCIISGLGAAGECTR
jgi:hypothetical protein